MDKNEFVYKNLFEKRIVSALEDKVVIDFKNPIREYHVEYRYSDLASRVVTGRIGDSAWTNIGYVLVVALMLVIVVIDILFPIAFQNPYIRLIPLGIAALAIISFSLRLAKYDCIWFSDKEGNTAFVLQLTRENQEQGAIVNDYILSNIKKHESKS